MTLASAIDLIKTVEGIGLNQKNVAFFKEINYEEGNGFLSDLDIDTRTILGGAFTKAEEILKGGKSSLGGAVDEVISFALPTDLLQAQSSKTSRIFEHPLEWNASGDKLDRAQNFIAEHSIEMPTAFSAGIILPSVFYSSVMNELSELFKTKTLCAIVCKGMTLRNMVLVEYSIPYTVERLSRLPVLTRWREIQGNYETSPVAASPDNQ